MRALDVGLALAPAPYCAEAPYHAAEAYPESPFPARIGAVPNPAYAALRDLFRALAMDAENAGTAAWNPLKSVVRPGDTVVVKPNFVESRHPRGGELFAAITHPSVLRAVADYVYVALGGRGRIVIADAPQMDCDWEQLMAATRLPEVQALYRRELGFPLEVLDLRDFCVADPDEQAYSTNRRRLPGDPAGEVLFDLGERSRFFGLANHDRFYGADYDREETIRNHNGRVHRYAVSGTVMRADAVISVPKLKVHKKVGATLNVKGLVGINTNKNYLVHYRLGTPAQGGDQLPEVGAGDRAFVGVQRFLYDALLARRSPVADRVYHGMRVAYRHTFKRFVRPSNAVTAYDGGNWHGNDTAWRMALDLLRVFTYGGADGVLHDAPQRRVFCVVDGIVGGQGDGPLSPDPAPAGCLVGGATPLAVDLAAARLMGFDPLRIRQFQAAVESPELGVPAPPEVRLCRVDAPPVPGDVLFSAEWTSPLAPFRPHPGWVGHVEV
jgi:uncharacterized protein (DUF362 family)